MADSLRNRRAAQLDNVQLAADTAQDEGEFEIDLVELMYRLLEKVHWIVIAALIGACIMGVYTYRFVTPTYQATAKLYILSNKDTVVDLTALNTGSKLASDYMEVFSVWEVHDMVRQDLNLAYTDAQISRMVSVRNPSDTRMLYITCTSASPKEAADLANSYAKVSRSFISLKMGTEEPALFEEAREPSRPSAPNNIRNIILGLMAGALVAAMIIVIQFITDDRIRTADSVEKHLHIPSLGMMPLQAHDDEEDYSMPDSRHHHKKSSKGGSNA